MRLFCCCCRYNVCNHWSELLLLIVMSARTKAIGTQELLSSWLCKAPQIRRSLLLTTLLVRGPEREVVTQQLHDERRVLVRVFGDIIELCDRVLKGCACHLACLLRVLQHLILE